MSRALNIIQVEAFSILTILLAIYIKQRILEQYKFTIVYSHEQELTRLSDTALAKYDGLVEPIAVLEACLWAVVQLRLLRDRHGQLGRRDLSFYRSILQRSTAKESGGL